MKKSFIFLFLMMMTAAVLAQSKTQDVLYLKNGSIIRGEVTEMIPDQSVKVKTTNNNVFVYPMEEVKKITKEVNPKAQDGAISHEERRSYIGISFGGAIPVGSFAKNTNRPAQTGRQGNLVNLGILFSEHVGMAVFWYGAVYPTDEKLEQFWGVGGIMIGPLFSFPLSEKVVWDVRPMMFGYAATTLPDDEDATVTSFAIDMGTTFRFNVGKRIALLLSADYFSTKAHFQEYHFKQNVGAISLEFGVAYRFK